MPTFGYAEIERTYGFTITANTECQGERCDFEFSIDRVMVTASASTSARVIKAMVEYEQWSTAQNHPSFNLLG